MGVFRIGFGVVGLLLVVRFFAHGWIDSLLIDPPFHFTYPGFGWVEPVPGSGMYVVMAIMGLAAISIAAGYRHRVGAAVFAIGLAYVELIDRTNFLNHYYWMVITALVMVFLPMSSGLSVESRQGGPTTVGMWVVWFLRFQVGMVYFFAGVAKLNSDWLFRAEPLATWLPARSHLWLIGGVLALPATAFALSWAGAFFDLTVVGWLMMKRTRLAAFVVLVSFHLATWLLFPSIGVFPLLMSLGAMIFFDPDWPERMSRSRRPITRIADRRLRPGWSLAAAIYVALMIVIPLRHHLIPGDVRWTSEGYQGSWMVMLSDRTGSVEFMVDDGESAWVISAPDYLTDRQRAVMATDPALIGQVVGLLEQETGGTVTPKATVAFNGRRSVTIDDAVAVWASVAP